MVHSEVVTDNVETVLLGFIGQTYCTLCCRMTSAPPPRLSSPPLAVPLRLIVFPLRRRRRYLPPQISLSAQVGAAFSHFLLTSNRPVFVFSSHTCVHTTRSENTLLSRLVNMLSLIYYLLPMGCISECAKQLFRGGFFAVIIM